MNNKMLLRVSTILNTLEAHPQGLSATELAELSGYPTDQILGDLNDILANTDLGSYFTIFTDEQEDDPEEENLVIKDIHLKWFIHVYAGPYVPVRLTTGEALDLLWLFEEFPPQDSDLVNLWQKLKAHLFQSDEIAATAELTRYLHTQGGVELAQNKHLQDLRKAVLAEQKIRLAYEAKSLKETVDWVLWPLGLIFHTGNGVWYLIAVRDDTGETVLCQTERIRDIKILEDYFNYPDNFSLRNYLKVRWGMDMSTSAQVKVRFYNEANVVEKVQKEFISRGLPDPVELHDGSLEYQGEILGIRNFSKWLLSFGSSVEVLEPAWLRKEMIGLAKNWAEMYEV